MEAALNCNIIPVLFFSRVKQSLDISRSWLAFLEILSSPSDHHLSLLADLWKKHNFHSFLVLKFHLFASQVSAKFVLHTDVTNKSSECKYVTIDGDNMVDLSKYT